MKELNSEQKSFLLGAIRDIPDFPKEGIVFKDITTLLNNKEAFSLLMNHLCARYEDASIDFIAGIESRGFVFGAALATKLNVGFVPIRKKGKLPSKTISQSYALEYGTDTIEMHIDAFRDIKSAKILLVDDLIATGGTAEASLKLIKSADANPFESCFLMNLTFLNGADKISNLSKVYSVIEL